MKKQSRNPEWDNSVFLYDHKFTKAFDEFMDKVSNLEHKIEESGEDSLDAENEAMKLSCLKEIKNVYGVCLRTFVLDI
jgi:hypothetical protein